MIYKYIMIRLEAREEGKRTDHWTVLSKSSGDKLGEIRWYAPWRQYWLQPSPSTGWSVGCMRDVCDFIGLQMRARKPVSMIGTMGSGMSTVAAAIRLTREEGRELKAQNGHCFIEKPSGDDLQ